MRTIKIHTLSFSLLLAFLCSATPLTAQALWNIKNSVFSQNNNKVTDILCDGFGFGWKMSDAVFFNALCTQKPELTEQEMALLTSQSLNRILEEIATQSLGKKLASFDNDRLTELLNTLGDERLLFLINIDSNRQGEIHKKIKQAAEKKENSGIIKSIHRITQRIMVTHYASLHGRHSSGKATPGEELQYNFLKTLIRHVENKIDNAIYCSANPESCTAKQTAGAETNQDSGQNVFLTMLGYIKNSIANFYLAAINYMAQSNWQENDFDFGADSALATLDRDSLSDNVFAQQLGHDSGSRITTAAPEALATVMATQAIEARKAAISQKLLEENKNLQQLTKAMETLAGQYQNAGQVMGQALDLYNKEKSVEKTRLSSQVKATTTSQQQAQTAMQAMKTALTKAQQQYQSWEKQQTFTRTLTRIEDPQILQQLKKELTALEQQLGKQDKSHKKILAEQQKITAFAEAALSLHKDITAQISTREVEERQTQLSEAINTATHQHDAFDKRLQQAGKRLEELEQMLQSTRTLNSQLQQEKSLHSLEKTIQEARDLLTTSKNRLDQQQQHLRKHYSDAQKTLNTAAELHQLFQQMAQDKALAPLATSIPKLTELEQTIEKQGALSVALADITGQLQNQQQHEQRQNRIQQASHRIAEKSAAVRTHLTQAKTHRDKSEKNLNELNRRLTDLTGRNSKLTTPQSIDGTLEETISTAWSRYGELNKQQQSLEHHLAQAYDQKKTALLAQADSDSKAEQLEQLLLAMEQDSQLNALAAHQEALAQLEQTTDNSSPAATALDSASAQVSTQQQQEFFQYSIQRDLTRLNEKITQIGDLLNALRPRLDQAGGQLQQLTSRFSAIDASNGQLNNRQNLDAPTQAIHQADDLSRALQETLQRVETRLKEQYSDRISALNSLSQQERAQQLKTLSIAIEQDHSLDLPADYSQQLNQLEQAVRKDAPLSRNLELAHQQVSQQQQQEHWQQRIAQGKNRINTVTAATSQHLDSVDNHLAALASRLNSLETRQEAIRRDNNQLANPQPLDEQPITTARRQHTKLLTSFQKIKQRLNRDYIEKTAALAQLAAEQQADALEKLAQQAEQDKTLHLSVSDQTRLELLQQKTADKGALTQVLSGLEQQVSAATQVQTMASQLQDYPLEQTIHTLQTLSDDISRFTDTTLSRDNTLREQQLKALQDDTKKQNSQLEELTETLSDTLAQIRVDQETSEKMHQADSFLGRFFYTNETLTPEQIEEKKAHVSEQLDRLRQLSQMAPSQQQAYSQISQDLASLLTHLDAATADNTKQLQQYSQRQQELTAFMTTLDSLDQSIQLLKTGDYPGSVQIKEQLAAIERQSATLRSALQTASDRVSTTLTRGKAALEQQQGIIRQGKAMVAEQQQKQADLQTLASTLKTSTEESQRLLQLFQKDQQDSLKKQELDHSQTIIAEVEQQLSEHSDQLKQASATLKAIQQLSEQLHTLQQNNQAQTIARISDKLVKTHQQIEATRKDTEKYRGTFADNLLKGSQEALSQWRQYSRSADMTSRLNSVDLSTLTRLKAELQGRQATIRSQLANDQALLAQAQPIREALNQAISQSRQVSGAISQYQQQNEEQLAQRQLITEAISQASTRISEQEKAVRRMLNERRERLQTTGRALAKQTTRLQQLTDQNQQLATPQTLDSQAIKAAQAQYSHLQNQLEKERQRIEQHLAKTYTGPLSQQISTLMATVKDTSQTQPDQAAIKALQQQVQAMVQDPSLKLSSAYSRKLENLRQTTGEASTMAADLDKMQTQITQQLQRQQGEQRQLMAETVRQANTRISEQEKTVRQMLNERRERLQTTGRALAKQAARLQQLTDQNQQLATPQTLDSQAIKAAQAQYSHLQDQLEKEHQRIEQHLAKTYTGPLAQQISTLMATVKDTSQTQPDQAAIKALQQQVQTMVQDPVLNPSQSQNLAALEQATQNADQQIRQLEQQLELSVALQTLQTQLHSAAPGQKLQALADHIERFSKNMLAQDNRRLTGELQALKGEQANGQSLPTLTAQLETIAGQLQKRSDSPSSAIKTLSRQQQALNSLNAAISNQARQEKERTAALAALLRQADDALTSGQAELHNLKTKQATLASGLNSLDAAEQALNALKQGKHDAKILRLAQDNLADLEQQITTLRSSSTAAADRTRNLLSKADATIAALQQLIHQGKTQLADQHQRQNQWQKLQTTAASKMAKARQQAQALTRQQRLQAIRQADQDRQEQLIEARQVLASHLDGLVLPPETLSMMQQRFGDSGQQTQKNTALANSTPKAPAIDQNPLQTTAVAQARLIPVHTVINPDENSFINAADKGKQAHSDTAQTASQMDRAYLKKAVKEHYRPLFKKYNISRCMGRNNKNPGSCDVEQTATTFKQLRKEYEELLAKLNGTYVDPSNQAHSKDTENTEDTDALQKIGMSRSQPMLQAFQQQDESYLDHLGSTALSRVPVLSTMFLAQHIATSAVKAYRLPALFGSNQSLTLDSLSPAQLQASRHISSNPVFNSGPGLWHSFIQVNGINGSWRKQQNLPGQSYNGSGLTLGLFKELDDNWMAGIMVASQTTHIKMNSAASKTRVDSLVLSPFASWRKNNWHIDGTLSLSQNDYYTKRVDGLGHRLKDKLQGTDWTAHITAGYDIYFHETSPGLVLTPTVSLIYHNTEISGLKEKGQSLQALRVRSRKHYQTTVKVGAELSYLMADKTYPTEFNASLGVQRQSMNSQRGRYDYYQRAEGIHNQYTTPTVHTTGVYYGLGVTRMMSDTSHFKIDFSGSLTQRSRDNALQLTFEKKF